MMTPDSYIWYVKAAHLTAYLLMAAGIFLRWDEQAKATRTLAIMFILMAVFYIADLIIEQYYDIHPFMLHQGDGVGYSFGALYKGMTMASFLYLYARAVFKPLKITIKILVRTNIISIISFLCYIIFTVLGFRPVPGYKMVDLINHLHDNPFASLWLITMICFACYAVYICCISLRWMNIHRCNIKNNFSRRGDFRYYYMYVIYFLLALTIPLGVVTLSFEANNTIKVLCGVLLMAMMLFVYIFSTLQQDIYSQEQPMEDMATIEPGIEDKHSIRINDRILIEKLNTLIEQEEIYRLSDLSAEILATRMKISRKKLYLFLKAYYHSTFSDYVNKCRLEHAERLITDKQNYHLSIVEISELSGFNTVATFNKFFKAKHSITPAKYRSTLEC